MKIFMISDTHFGISINNLDRNLSMMESTFYNFVIPYLKENCSPGDVLFHLGDLFDNRTSIPIIVLNKVEKILKELSDILPVHILIGNHDLWNKGSNDVNSVRLFSYISDNIFVYEKSTSLVLGGRNIDIIPWVEKRVDMIDEISKLQGEYLFCHSDLNGCKMHLNSVAHRNSDKIDVENFSKYKGVYSGHIHIVQNNKNFNFIGSLYQMDRNDMGDQKGITILDLDVGETTFEPNMYSPVFRKIHIKKDEDIEVLDSLKDTKDYIDLVISNSLLINNRKFRRKLEIILESGKFASVEYLDDIVKESKEIKIVEDSGHGISIELDYEDYVKNYIKSQQYESESIKFGVLSELEEIIKVYNDNYKSSI